jgi:small-conductance mechanosensitive channel
LTSKGASTVLLVVSLLFAAAVGILSPAVAAKAAATEMAKATPEAAMMVALLQDTPESSVETPELPPPETPQPPEETAEPAPTEPSQPPEETAEPTASNTSPPQGTAEKTAEAKDTATPGTAQPTAGAGTATAAATVTATSKPSILPTDWLLGTVRIGQEPGPPSEPIRVTMGEWLRLALALVVVLAVAILGAPLLYRLLRSIMAKRDLHVGETLLSQFRPLLVWWLAAIGFPIAVWWVDFQNGPARELFADLVFLVYLVVATLTAWRLVDQAIDLYAGRISAEGPASAFERLRPILRRWARMLIVLFSILVGLGRFAGGLSVPTVLVTLMGLTISLAARDTLSDVIAGFSILIDQPFRIGDRIQVRGVDIWAEVVNIGLRTSVLLTRHNVEIIVPNSTISKNQVINYSYPDPSYRLQTHVGIAFGTDIEHARQVMIEAVQQVEGVLPEEPVDCLYVEVADSAMIFRVRWWIDFHRDWEKSYDNVHTALHHALAEAGIDSPYPGQSVYLDVEARTMAEVWQAWQGEGENSSSVVGDDERAAE